MSEAAPDCARLRACLDSSGTVRSVDSGYKGESNSTDPIPDPARPLTNCSVGHNWERICSQLLSSPITAEYQKEFEKLDPISVQTNPHLQR